MTEYQAGRYRIGILYEDNHLLIALKPQNMPVQADASGDLDMQSALKGYIKEKYNKPGDVFLALCHRLDRPVGGVMALCRTSKCAERMTKQFASHTVEKTYLCVVKGELNETINPEDYLLKDERGMVRVVSPDTKGAKRASLTAAPIAHADGLTLVKVELHTGRSTTDTATEGPDSRSRCWRRALRLTIPRQSSACALTVPRQICSRGTYGAFR